MQPMTKAKVNDVIVISVIKDITDLCELTNPFCIAVGSLCKKIVMYDLNKRTVIRVLRGHDNSLR